MFEGNPIYNTMPVTPPGLEGFRYMFGPAAAAWLFGGQTSPYIAPNQGPYEALMSKHVNAALYRTMMSNMYTQMGQQIGNTFGNMDVVQRLGSVAGLTPEQTKAAVANGGRALGASGFAQYVMPLVDSGLSAIGLTGGSMLGVAQSAYSQRMNLLTAGTLINPSDSWVQHSAMMGASAVASLLNGLMSQTKDGKTILNPNLNVTQGFNREKIANIVMQAAGRGMFTSNSYIEGSGDVPTILPGGLMQRMYDAAGGMDLSLLEFDAKDFSGGGKDSLLTKESARRVQDLTKEFANRLNGITETMAAMRDLTHEVDGIEEKLDALTNGNWLRSGKGAYGARDAIRRLHAITIANNLSPQAALGDLVANRSVLQNAAGFDAAMTAMGFDGGGMFGLPAQTELLATVEDMVNERGIRGDPILSGRLRQQARQAMARNMNTIAGRGAQVLAYAWQTGAIDQKTAEDLQAGLVSGDRGIMGATLNRLLTTVFGSAEVGRRFMNDQMQMNNMRQAMSDEAGLFANRTIIRGADAEFGKRGEVVAAQQRLEFTKQLMGEAGMRTWQSDADVRRMVDAVVLTIDHANGLSGGESGEPRTVDSIAFVNQYEARVRGGMKPLAAFTATKAAFARNILTAHYSEQIDKGVTRQAALNNEWALKNGGRESYQASNTAKALLDAGFITGAEHLGIAKMVRDGNGKEALERVRGIVGGLDEQNRALFGNNVEQFGIRYDHAVQTMEDNAAAETAVATAGLRHFGAGQVAKAYLDVVGAARDYFNSKREGADYIDFLSRYSGSKFDVAFGGKRQKEVLDALKKGDTKFFDSLGRQAAAIQRMNVGNLQDNGYSLNLDGYWGEGKYSGNSQDAFEARNKLVAKIATQMVDSGQTDMGKATTLSQDIVSFFLGNGSWKSIMKMYDVNNEMGSLFSNYVTAFDKMEEARSDVAKEAKSGDYRKALQTLLETERGAEKVEFLNKLLANGVNGDEGVRGVQNFLMQTGLEKTQAGMAAINTISGYAVKLSALGYAQSSAEEKLGEAMSAPGSLNVVNAWASRRDKKLSLSDRLLGDNDLKSFIDDIWLNEDGTVGLGDAKRRPYLLGKALDKLKDVVSADEVAAASGRESGDKLSKAEYLSGAIPILRKKVATGDDTAVEAFRAFKAASMEGVTKIRGELIIRSGNERQPAVLEGSAGGLQQ